MPHARFEKYVAIDKSEIELANEISELIQNYKRNYGDKRPLSIAVFGQPGSGKSFAVKQIALSLIGETSFLTYNVSQFERVSDLRHAFDEIRNASVKGQIPVVFWDEFDAGNYKWLKSFLAPMQDAVFSIDGGDYPFGRAIFVFAGGVNRTYEAFEKVSLTAASDKDLKSAKIPDFMSRLRGYLNVKDVQRGYKGDYQYLLRRAVIFRTAVQNHAPHLIGENHTTIDGAVTRAFLEAEEYLHGARSIEALVSMSSLQAATRFRPEHLPSAEQGKLHTKQGLRELARDIESNRAFPEQLTFSGEENLAATIPTLGDQP